MCFIICKWKRSTSMDKQALNTTRCPGTSSCINIFNKNCLMCNWMESKQLNLWIHKSTYSFVSTNNDWIEVLCRWPSCNRSVNTLLFCTSENRFLCSSIIYNILSVCAPPQQRERKTLTLTKWQSLQVEENNVHEIFVWKK